MELVTPSCIGDVRLELLLSIAQCLVCRVRYRMVLLDKYKDADLCSKPQGPWESEQGLFSWRTCTVGKSVNFVY